MGCLKLKNHKLLLLIKRKIWMAQKKYGYLPKKVRLGFRGFCTYFWEVDHPYVMFESKKLKFLVLIRRKLTTPYVMFEIT